MQVAELFVNLGIKGADKTVGSLGNVKKGLGEVSSMSLEAKAAILGAMYGFERMMAASGKVGTGLTNLSSLIGVNAQTMQQYNYAARQVGVSNDEMEGSFKSLQSVTSKMLMGEGGPKGLAQVAKLTGGFTQSDALKFQQNPDLLIQKLQQYAQKEKNTGLRNEVLKSFGLGDTMIAGLARGAFSPTMLSKAPTYSDKEIGSLDKANIAWSNLGNKIEMAFGHFNAKHGGQLVGDISKLVPEVLKLVEAFTKLTEKIKLFEVIGKIFEGWGMIFEGMTAGVDKITTFADSKDKWGDLKKGAAEVAKFAPVMLNQLRSDEALRGAYLPKVAQPLGGGHTTTINQNITHIGDAKDTKGVKDLHGAAARHAKQNNQAVRQMPAQKRGS